MVGLYDILTLFVFKQKTAYEIDMWLEFRRVLFRSLETDPDPAVRQTAAIALGYIGNRALIPSLLKGLNDPHDGTRFASVNSLGILRDASAAKALSEKLKDSDPRMRKSASYALSKM